MKLPNPEQAEVDLAKLREYCLNLPHPRGRHKARVFAAALGLTQRDAAFLRTALLEAAHNSNATFGEKDEYGQRFVLDFEMKGPGGKAIIRSSWIVLTGENIPRLTSCYVF